MRGSTRIGAIAAATAAAITVAGGAVAAPPTHEDVGSFAASFTAGEVCEFPVTIMSVVSRERSTTFFAPDGTIDRIQVTGRLVLQLTNDATGKTATVNASGPGTLTFNPDGSVTLVGRGITLYYLRAGLDTGGPDILLLHGRNVVRLTDTLTLVSAAGSSRSLCSLVA